MPDLFTRAAAGPATVRFPDRCIDVLAIPYDTPQPIVDSHGSYTETFLRGAFGNVQGRPNRVKVLRDHLPERSIGRAMRLLPNRADGLHATLYVSPTPLGDESLQLAADGVLDVSVGFTPMDGGMEWTRDRDAVTWSSVWLREISLVPLPAYEDAHVLAVRNAQLTEERPPLGRALARLAEYQADADNGARVLANMVGNSAQDLGELADAVSSGTPNLDNVLAWLASRRVGAPQ